MGFDMDEHLWSRIHVNLTRSMSFSQYTGRIKTQSELLQLEHLAVYSWRGTVCERYSHRASRVGVASPLSQPQARRAAQD